MVERYFMVLFNTIKGLKGKMLSSSRFKFD